MVTVNSIHELSNDETSILKDLIGKSLIAIKCSGADLTSGLLHYDFIDAVNLVLKGKDGFISVSAEFDETNFGDDFIKINITKEKYPIGINVHEQGGLQHPFVNLEIFPEFLIKKIEVYGDSYSCHSDNNIEERYWQIEINNPGKSITEIIETENIIVFHSANGRLMIRPYGAVPWIQVTFDNHLIDQVLLNTNNEGQYVTKLKHDLNENWA